MGRQLASDFLHSMRFHVVCDDGSRPQLQPAGRPEAGFNSVTTPEATVEAVEYREGTFVYTRKQPGNASMSDISCSRGVARGDSSFWDWLRIVIEGGGEYRQDLQIRHYGREALVGGGGGQTNLTRVDTDQPARTYYVKEAFPSRHKLAADMDATSSEISIMELDLAYERFEVQEHGELVSS